MIRSFIDRAFFKFIKLAGVEKDLRQQSKSRTMKLVMNPKGFTNIVVIIGIVILVGIAGYFINTRQTLFQKPTGGINSFEECVGAGYPVAESYPRRCVTPDGKYFIEESTGGAPKISLQEGQRESSFLLEKIYPDHITGLNFAEYPIPLERGYPITLRIGETVSNGCTITLTLVGIEGSTATFIKNTDFNRPCPICLAENTLIDTPFGAIPVQQLQKGMTVWTVNGLGERISATIIKTAKTPVPSTHQIIHLVLEDGRELFASSGHPIGDGRTIGGLSTGDSLDGVLIRIAELLPYQKSFTYDILPSGETGFYWANSILIGSTLSVEK